MVRWLMTLSGAVTLAAGTLAVSRAGAVPAVEGPAAGGVQAAASPAEAAKAAKTIGPEQSENNCASCHAVEDEAWQNTRHYATFNERHRSPRAQEILQAMGLRTMKRVDTCRQCHYTSVMVGDAVTPQWGVSCESCHGPGKDWNGIHNRPAGNPTAPALKWGTIKNETAADRQARLGAAAAKGMIHSAMIYDIATNCFGCHTVPNEELVNKGKHHAGSDFDLVAWSQGEVRHNFVSSPGAPDKPTNRPASANQRRRLYVVGAMVDLEVSLRNLAGVKQKGGDFEKAMIERVTRGRGKLQAMVKAVAIPEIAAAVAAVPASVDASVPASVAEGLRNAGRQFAAKNDGSALGPLDALMPKAVKGTVYKP